MGGEVNIYFQEAFVSGLECEVAHVPDSDPVTAALLFHPWAWLGGSMWDPVVDALMRLVKPCHHMPRMHHITDTATMRLNHADKKNNIAA